MSLLREMSRESLSDSCSSLTSEDIDLGESWLSAKCTSDSLYPLFFAYESEMKDALSPKCVLSFVFVPNLFAFISTVRGVLTASTM